MGLTGIEWLTQRFESLKAYLNYQYTISAIISEYSAKKITLVSLYFSLSVVQIFFWRGGNFVIYMFFGIDCQDLHFFWE